MKNAGPRPILLSGASGLIGSSLRSSFRKSGTKVLQLVRPGPRPNNDQVTWHPHEPIPIGSRDLSRLEGSTAAIHLSGASVAGHRWTKSYKQSIRESRIQSTSALAKILAGMQSKPPILLCASAVGIYGDRGNEPLDEASSLGSGFLAEVCKDWEQSTHVAEDAGIRVIHMRIGVVLSPEGGALKSMLPPFRLGLGARLGSGRQWMSWIAISDLVRAILFILDDQELSGAVNLVAPEPVTNLAFTQALAEELRRPAFLAIPAFALDLALGEMADGALLASQRALPQRLLTSGFAFEHANLRSALASMLSEGKTANH